ncbi:pleckstrin homology domain-containing family A member 5-like isoform X1 [Sphaeramia orbicularis]|uniref:pleckstrin homology domain-containing family A member 5-like isoform X1 n=1 Tax=Sphaeramia orbicularis TaxID=375764 RepID=UPI00117FFF7F|nr:pleckstrin homology domain-containing family A member 5-like isoform X1 [Sphaeramia orbicularis]
MAADPQPEWLSCLPSSWSYGVTRDGRIFFINEEAKSTTWLHPVTGEAIITGHRKTPDLPTGWEEGYTFEGARCFINHNERKVTCKHPVSGVPSQDNCIFVVNEHVNCGKLVHPDKPVEALSRPAAKPSSEQGSVGDKKERPTSTMSEASNYTGGSDYSTFHGSPATTVTTATTTTSASSTRPSRSSKKVHNFGKRSNSIKRNPNAPVVKNGWLYKQDSTGMKLWKKRWFVLSDMCLFYYRDEKEDTILGSILLPSFHISMLSVDDHISRKYAFKATHPNMRTYYFCTDTSKEMESWMKVMTDAALVHIETTKRVDKLKVDQRTPQELNNVQKHRVLTRPEIQNNERNREPVRHQSISRADDKHPKESEKRNSQRDRESYTLQRDGDKYCLTKDGVSYMLHKEGDRYLLHKDGHKYLLRQDGDKYCLQKDGEVYAIHRDLEKYAVQKTDEKYTAALAPEPSGEKYLLAKDGDKYGLQNVGDRHTLQKDGQKYLPQKEVKRQLSLKETDRRSAAGDSKYGTIHVLDKYGTLKEVKKYSTLREGDTYAALREAEKYATVRDRNKCGFQRDLSAERPLTKISSIKLQPAQAAAIAAAVSASRQGQANRTLQKPAQVHDSRSKAGEQGQDRSPTEVDGTLAKFTGKAPVPAPGPGPAPVASVQEAEKGLTRTGSMQQLEHWVRTQRTRGLDDDNRSVTSYQTLPRNMPSHRAQIVPRYPEGYRTLPRNSVMRPESICSVTGSVYDRALHPVSTGTVTTAEKRRSMRDDTMWQLYEWQQRQAFSRHSMAPPTAAAVHYGTLPNTKTMGSLSEHAVAHSIPTSPSHGSLALYSTLPPPNPPTPHSEVSSPVFRGDVTLDRRHRTHLAKYGYPPDRRSVAIGVPSQTITPQSLQGKTPEELTLLLIKLRRQQAELTSLREHTVAQLMALGLEGPNAKTDVLTHHLQRNLIYLDSQTKENEPLIFMIHTMIENSAPRPQLYQQVSPDEYKDGSFIQRTEDVDVDTKLSRLCEQDKAVKMQEEKLQQLHREKHTLETALLSASQELSEQSGSNGATVQSLVQQRDVLQNGLLSTCRELARVNTELERSWRDYDRLETDVTQAKSNLLEQLEALGSPQTEPPSQRHIQIQKELWRIQDVMEALAKNKPQRTTNSGFPGSKPLSSQQKNEAVTPLPLSPLKDANPVPPRPPLPQYYDSSERPPHVPPHHSHPSGRLPPPTHRPEDRKPGTRNGTHSQAPDYRLYKSEPELTTVKEEVDEANGDDKDKDKDKVEAAAEGKDAAGSKVPPYPVGIVPPRTKSPMNPPESSTIASYVTLRKTKKPENRSDRPQSAVDHLGFGEREVGRTRMSVEEQLERMRRNQEASCLREKRRETPSRSPSFSKDNPFIILQSRVQAEGSCADPVELEAALQQLKDQRRTNADTHPGPSLPQEAQRAEDGKNDKCKDVQQDRDVNLKNGTPPQDENDGMDQVCERQTVVILDLGPEPQHVDLVTLQSFEEDESRDGTSSPTNTTTDNSFQTPEPETPSPEPKEPDVTPASEEKLEKSLDSYNQLTTDDKKHNNNNNNMLASQTFTLVTSDT